jgi:hypothetical protein
MPSRPLPLAVIAVLAAALLAFAAGAPRAVAQQVGTVQPTTASISTDRPQYAIGDPIQVCYRIPVAGFITITDLPSSQQTHVFYQGPSAGTGACLPGTVTPPAGNECLILSYPQPAGGTGRVQTCFRVTGPVPPSGWIEAGVAQVDSTGTFHFSGQFPLPANLTYMRVSGGACTANPASTLVWEGALRRDTGTPPGVEAWTGGLAPTGLAVSNGGGGFSHLSRPVTNNPVTQVTATIFGVGIINADATFTVCLRAP